MPRGPLRPLAIASVAVLLLFGMAAPALADDPPTPPRAIPAARSARAAPSGSSYNEVVSFAQESARDLVALQQEAHEVATERNATLAQITTLADLTFKRTAVRDRLEREALRLSASTRVPDDTLPAPVRDAVDEMRALRAELTEQYVTLDAKATELARYAATIPATGALTTPAVGEVTQGFGPTSYGFEPAREYRGTLYAHFHEGIDIGAGIYSPVIAAAPGRVVWVGHLPDGAMVVLIAHSGGLVSLYAHLDDGIAPPRVAAGDQVQRGQTIAAVGMTGMTTGPHLHFVVWRDGELIDPLSVIAP
jgi:murein DD-endopeptidase MepM/ murein hydrolase activator NlpD